MKLFHIFIFSLLSCVLIAQQELRPELTENLNQRIAYGINQSIAIAVVDGRETNYYNFGTSVKDGNTVDEHSIYEIGSISKVFTGLMLADMVVKGEVKLDDPISKYLPKSVKCPTYNGQDITLGHLSDHTSSLPRMPDNIAPADPENPYADYTTAQLYAFLSTAELSRPIGSEYEYSNLAQGLLSHIMELITGLTFDELLAQRITRPLDMFETKAVLDDSMKAHLAYGHDQGVRVSNWDIATLTGAGGIRSSTSDMVKFIRLNLGMAGKDLQKAVKLAQKERHDKANGRGVGLGWHIVHNDGKTYYRHGGATGGYKAHVTIDPDSNRGVVVLTNSTSDVGDIGYNIIEPESKIKPVSPDFAMLLRETIDNYGIEAGKAMYEKSKMVDSEYEINESSLNQLGYYYMGKDQLDEALTVFKINIDAFPEAFNVYDSYAEGLMNKSIQYYKKSIELNPGNQNGYDQLAKMGVEIEQKSPTLSEADLKKYCGEYQLAPEFKIEITAAGNQIFAQATNQPRFEIFPRSEDVFYLKVVEASIEFVKEGNEVTSLILHQGGQSMPGKKIK